MELVSWKAEYSVGVEEIDSQHRKLIGMIRRLQQSILNDLTSPVVRTTLISLVEYTRVHFRDEEALWTRMHYHKLDEHKQKHRRLVREIMEILKNLKAGKELSAIDLITFLRHWLIDHIVAEDRKAGVLLQDRLSRLRPARLPA